MLGAYIDEGLSLGHPTTIIIYSGVRIGKNCCIRQCTTIGSIEVGNKAITLGDNVDIGAHTCIIGSGLTIGSNVRIGAMSFVNKDIPDDVTYITRKESFTRPNKTSGT
jgi:serine O-acetyltransferase